MDAEILHTMLIVYLVVACVAAMLYLHQRRMPFGVYAFLGFFALLIPTLGPFVVIAVRPGQSTRCAERGSSRCGR